MKTAAAARSPQTDEELVIKGQHFTRMLQSVELLHRRFLDIITMELGQRDKTLSSVQALILSHAHGKSISLGELQALGHYEGTNLAYNVGKLAQGGYATLTRPQWDKRSSCVELTAEGREVAQLVAELLAAHAGLLPQIGISEADLVLTTRMLKGLNRLWSV